MSCPGCGARLRVRDDTAEQRFTCPRCLAPVPIRNTSGAGEEILTALPADPAPQRVPALRVRSPDSFRLADADVRRDTGSMSVGLGLLGILILLAVVLTFVSGFGTGKSFTRGSSAKWAEAVVPIALLVAGLVTLAAPVPIMVRMFRGRDVGAGRVFLGIVLYFAILGTTLVSLFVLFFVACLAGLSTK